MHTNNKTYQANSTLSLFFSWIITTPIHIALKIAPKHLTITKFF